MKFETFKEQYEQGTLQITGNVKYNVRDVIEKNYQLMHGQFEEANMPDGSPKIFYRLIWAMINIILRNTDIDTKNLNVHSLNGLGQKIMPFVKGALRWFLNVINYGRDLNEQNFERVGMGHLLVKVVNNKAKIVNLLNTIIPPHVDSVQDSGLIEITFPTYWDLEKKKDRYKENWKDIEEIHEKMKQAGEVYFTKYEFWTEDEFDGKYQKGCIEYLDRSILNPKEAKNPSDWTASIEIDRYPATTKKYNPETEKWEQCYPYWESRFGKIKGRYLGFGVCELLAGLQEDFNERMNLKRDIDRQALTGILIHRLPSNITDKDKIASITQEFLNNISQSALMEVQSDENLERLNSQIIPDFIPMIDKLFELMKIILGITAQGTGETLPANMPATVSVINQQNAQTTFDMVIEEQHLFQKELFYNFLLKDIIKKLTAKKLVEIIGDPSEIEELDNILTENLLNTSIAEFQDNYGTPGIIKNGKPKYFTISDPAIYEQEYNQELQELRDKMREQGQSRFPELKKELLKGIEFGVEFFVSNESFDKINQNKDLLAIAQIPDAPLSRKKILEQVIENSDLDARRFQKTKQEEQEEIERARAMAMAESSGMPDTSIPLTPGEEMGNNLAL